MTNTTREDDTMDEHAATHVAELDLRQGDEARSPQCGGGLDCRCPVVTPCYPDRAARVDRA